MFFNDQFTGTSLPDKTLCLTFDDGPGETAAPGSGPRTVDIARYLNSQGIKGTFFMVGKFASDVPHILPEVESLGHLIGNHTYEHPLLPQFRDLGGNVEAQVQRTDALIRNWIDAPVVYFRAPYIGWDSSLASRLNADLTLALSHVGPIGIDIDGGDWDVWANNGSPQNAVSAYMQSIQANKQRGIILMHDCTADQAVVAMKNRTLELVQLLVPLLKGQGYKFCRVDEIPGMPGGDQRALRIALRGSNGQYVSPQGGGGGPVIVNGPAVGPWEPLVIEDLYVGKVALRVASGQYISPQNGGGGAVLADGPVVGAWEPLDLISLGNHQVAFRTITGSFLFCDTANGNALTATPNFISLQSECVFTYEFLP